MGFWSVDLTTEDGAVGAARLGGAACFVTAGLTALSFVIIVGLAPDKAAALGAAPGMAVEFLIFLAAGFRLRAGGGLVWGIAAALVMVIEIVAKLIVFTGPFGILINAVLLVLIVNGVRAAWALRKGIVDPEAEAEIFS